MKSRRASLSVFLLALTVLSAGFAARAGAVTLRSETEVSSAAVRLSDVFDGLPDGVDTDIARAPAPGKSITYGSTVLAHLVEQYNLDWKVAHSDRTTITTIGVKITGTDIRDAIIEKMAETDVKGEIDVQLDNHGFELTIAGNRSDFTLNNFDYDAANKRFHANLSAEGFSGPVNVPLAGHIIIKRSVPVLVRRLEAGTVIGAADIDWINIPEDRTVGVVTEADQLINHEVRHDVDAGQPLRAREIAPPRYVVRGTLVTMKIETPFMTVTAQGRALQDGKLGDVVRVVNTQSNRMVEGLVDGAGTVRVSTPQKVAAAETHDNGERP